MDTDRVLDVALETFLAAGVANTTMTGIARACGLSRGALYLRFSGKEEIFRAAVEHELDLWMSIPSLTYAQEIIEAWLTSVRARPGTVESNNAYISDCLRFFTVQIRAAAPR